MFKSVGIVLICCSAVGCVEVGVPIEETEGLSVKVSDNDTFPFMGTLRRSEVVDKKAICFYGSEDYATYSIPADGNCSKFIEMPSSRHHKEGTTR